MSFTKVFKFSLMQFLPKQSFKYPCVSFYHMIKKYTLNHVHKEGYSEEEIYGAYKLFFGTLFSESRLKILNLLRKGNKNVSEIVNELKATDRTSVSHDLTRLKIHGFVKMEIKGKYRHYTLNEDTIKPLMKLIDKHMSQYCIHILKAMKKIGKSKRKTI